MMDSLKETEDNADDETDLDPRIRIELEQLNNATDDINKLEMQLDEANTTFRILMNDSTRRLKQCARKIGSSIDRARSYYEALDISRRAHQECQVAASKFQRANEIHKAAKETVALAEARFLSKQHEWEFDNAWQEMLNHATIKVTEAENQKAESGREHQKRATLFNAAEQKVQILEQRLKRSIAKSRPYFEEKAICQSKLDAQKCHINQLESAIAKAKARYAASLRRLEQISEEIHLRRRDKSGSASPRGPREPGVGAELEVVRPVETPQQQKPISDNCCSPKSPSVNSKFIDDALEIHNACSIHVTADSGDHINNANRERLLTVTSSDCEYDLDNCDIRSLGSMSRATSSAVSEGDDLDDDPLEEDLEELRQRVRELAVAGEEQGEGWESELTATINKLDNALMMKECEEELKGMRQNCNNISNSPTSNNSAEVCEVGSGDPSTTNNTH
ncbi:SH3 domain-binding protein 5 homolog [Lycorma delicatula]|uniref:SH3 domain-binding protein 5 homolog n=1 Tax=Lycorma delicatula TaxID=130591 RepID=UPI003F518E0D